MNKALAYVAGLIGAVLTAVILHVLAQREFNISQESIVLGSLAFAGILSMAFAVGALVKTSK
jgi:hypothetical protein